jgi:hypothetical protein
MLDMRYLRLVSGVAVAIAVSMAAAGPVAAATSRAYELVSPPDKGDGQVVPGFGAHASASGDRIFFVGQGAFADAPTGTLSNKYYAERRATGWSTRSPDPPIVGRLVSPQYPFFTSDLARGVESIDADIAELASGDTLGNPDLYLRDYATDTYEVITTQPPVTPDPGNRPQISWASGDLSHVLFGVGDPQFAYFPGGPEQGAYHATAGGVTLASVLPDGTPAATAGAGSGIANDSWGHEHSISEDGRRIFFSVPGVPGAFEPTERQQIYVREDDGMPGAETVHISAPEAGVSDPNGEQAAFFRTASADGSKALFTSCERLTADSTADAGTSGNSGCLPDQGMKSDLYLFDVEAGDLMDLTTEDPSGADVRGFVGASDDGSRAYFVAYGVLDTGATAGAPNLYLWDQDSGITHIATLDPDVDMDPGINLQFAPGNPERTSRVSPDGRYLAFESVAPLDPDHDNGGFGQVYLYDAQAGKLVCASCVGAGPAAADATLHSHAQTGAGILDAPFFEPQNLANHGGILFFETAAGLVEEDFNGKLDVYEYDSGTGKLSLVSTGRGSFPSHFAGASATGDSVFITTRERLVGWDTDDAMDLYSARVGGGFPEPEPTAPPCRLECQGQPSRPPGLQDPGSQSFDGPGDVSPGRRPSFSVPPLSAVQRARLARGLPVGLRVRVNRRGTVRVVLRARTGGRRRVVASGSRGARRAGLVRVRLRLSRAARHQLAREGGLSVTASVRFTGVRSARRLSFRLAPARAVDTADRRVW